MPTLNKSQPITLPLVLPIAFDIRVYAVDCVVQALRLTRYGMDTLEEEAKANLLVAFSAREKPRLWVEFGAQLILPVIEILHTTNNQELQKQCLISMHEHFITSPSLRQWQLFVSYNTPYRLVGLIKVTNPGELRDLAISSFESFSGYLMSMATDNSSRPSLRHDLLRSLILCDLFETLVNDIMFKNGVKHMVAWKYYILQLPDSELLAKDNERDALRLGLKQFCEQHRDTSEGELAHFVKVLKGNLVCPG
ncbi:hypothetical protein FRC12_007216 [Ceratobasidium sp. 428]|nr:hypothetical protein FRC12_007216 [Ceratobasidium sp. 428]